MNQKRSDRKAAASPFHLEPTALLAVDLLVLELCVFQLRPAKALGEMTLLRSADKAGVGIWDRPGAQCPWDPCYPESWEATSLYPQPEKAGIAGVAP